MPWTVSQEFEISLKNVKSKSILGRVVLKFAKNIAATCNKIGQIENISMHGEILSSTPFSLVFSKLFFKHMKKIMDKSSWEAEPAFSRYRLDIDYVSYIKKMQRIIWYPF